MILSMTGFGRRDTEINGRKICIDIKSLNSKQLDLYVRTPSCFKEKEYEIRKLLTSVLIRGKIDCSIYFDNKSGDNLAELNTAVISGYYEQIKSLAIKNNIPIGTDILSAIIKLPEVHQTNNYELKDEDWLVLSEKLDESLDDCRKFRHEEGREIERDISERISNILKSLSEIEIYENERIHFVKERLANNLNLLSNDSSFEKNRFEQEIIYYLEKLDINEEKSRLKKHCDYFMQIVNDNESQGKKLGFIAQEIGREINTLGSKANHAEMQKIVVNMKDNLEKIKEQLLNVL